MSSETLRQPNSSGSKLDNRVITISSVCRQLTAIRAVKYNSLRYCSFFSFLNEQVNNERYQIFLPFFRKVGNPNASLVLTVVDRDVTLGNITLPVFNLPSAAHKRRWLPLQRKHQQTSSDLCFDCWVTSFKKETVWNRFNPFFSSTR